MVEEMLLRRTADNASQVNAGDQSPIHAFIQGLTDRAGRDHAVTAVEAAGGGAAGVAVAFARNNPELLKGTMGKLGKYAPLVVPAVLAEEMIRRGAQESTWQGRFHAAGEAAFDVLVPAAMGVVGYQASSKIPTLSRLTQPRVVSEMPAGLKYSVLGDDVVVHGFDKAALNSTARDVQVRLANGKGFTVDLWQRGPQNPALKEMPKSLADGTQLEYNLTHTVVTKPSGFTFKQFPKGEIEMVAADGSTIASNGRTLTVIKDGSTATYRDGSKSLELGGKGGSIVEEGGHVRFTHADGWSEAWAANGRYSANSQLNRHRIIVEPDGTGTYIYRAGTDRALRGMGSARVRHAPWQETTTKLEGVDLTSGRVRYANAIGGEARSNPGAFEVTYPKPTIPNAPALHPEFAALPI